MLYSKEFLDSLSSIPYNSIGDFQPGYILKDYYAYYLVNGFTDSGNLILARLLDSGNIIGQPTISWLNRDLTEDYSKTFKMLIPTLPYDPKQQSKYEDEDDV